MKALAALGGGLAGAVTLTIIHEGIKKIDPKAPRMDLLGMQSLSKILRGVGQMPPKGENLYWATMAGDLISNALYYSVVGLGERRNILFNGLQLGASAGLGAVVLPKYLGLNNRHSNRTTKTGLMTVAYYLIGGLVASAVTKSLLKRKK